MTKTFTALAAASLGTLLALFAPAPFARADIFKWEFINPANPALGKQQSTMLTSGGVGVNAAPLADLTSRNLTMAYLVAADLSGATIIATNLTNAELSLANLSRANLGAYFDEFSSYPGADLTGASLSQANLSSARFDGARLDGANLTDAEVRGANFNRYNGVGGISLTQLYSTASYHAHDLTGINLGSNNLVAADLVGQNLTGAGFYYASLTGADFFGAEVRGAKFYRDIYGGTGITATQLYSTSSYQAHDLRGVTLYGNDLAGVNLAGQNLANAGFPGAKLFNANFSQANLTNANFSPSFDYVSSDLSGANLSHANLTNANFTGVDICGEFECDIVPGASLTGANLSGADARGANFQYATLDGAKTTNLIQPNGHIAGLDLTAGGSLVVRDYDGNSGGYLWYPYPSNGPLPITVEHHLAMNTTGRLRLVFDADAWDSTISFAPGIPVALGGTLDLAVAPGVNLAAQSGRTIDLFDWTGVLPSGAFTISSPYTWNLSKLYTTGEVTLGMQLAGDYNGNGTVGPEDYNLWKVNFGSTENLAADGNGDGRVNAADYTVWRNNLGATLVASSGVPIANVPEPATLMLLIVGMTASFAFRRAAVSGRIARRNLLL